MKISVITVCLNSEKTIERTIKSLIGQTHNNIEYIVIDGNSKDSTVNIIKSYSKYINYFISEKDEGLYSALNKGIKASTGDIISILHSNDVFYNDDVLKKINNIFETGNIDFLFTSVCYKKNFDNSKAYRVYKPGFKPWMLRFGYSPPHTGFFAKKNELNKIGKYDEKLKIASDFEFFVRLFLSKNIKYLTKDFITITMSLGGLSTSGLSSYTMSTKEIVKSLKQNKIYSNYMLACVRFIIKIFQLKL